ncbi:MAG: hypothetical protein AB8B55_05815 [Mariniblastus sp.]
MILPLLKKLRITLRNHRLTITNSVFGGQPDGVVPLGQDLPSLHHRTPFWRSKQLAKSKVFAAVTGLAISATPFCLPTLSAQQFRTPQVQSGQNYGPSQAQLQHAAALKAQMLRAQQEQGADSGFAEKAFAAQQQYMASQAREEQNQYLAIQQAAQEKARRAQRAAQPVAFAPPTQARRLPKPNSASTYAPPVHVAPSSRGAYATLGDEPENRSQPARYNAVPSNAAQSNAVQQVAYQQQAYQAPNRQAQQAQQMQSSRNPNASFPRTGPAASPSQPAQRVAQLSNAQRANAQASQRRQVAAQTRQPQARPQSQGQLQSRSQNQRPSQSQIQSRQPTARVALNTVPNSRRQVPRQQTFAAARPQPTQQARVQKPRDYHMEGAPTLPKPKLNGTPYVLDSGNTVGLQDRIESLLSQPRYATSQTPIQNGQAMVESSVSKFASRVRGVINPKVAVQASVNKTSANSPRVNTPRANSANSIASYQPKIDTGFQRQLVQNRRIPNQKAAQRLSRSMMNPPNQSSEINRRIANVVQSQQNRMQHTAMVEPKHDPFNDAVSAFPQATESVMTRASQDNDISQRIANVVQSQEKRIQQVAMVEPNQDTFNAETTIAQASQPVMQTPRADYAPPQTQAIDPQVALPPESNLAQSNSSQPDEVNLVASNTMATNSAAVPETFTATANQEADNPMRQISILRQQDNSLRESENQFGGQDVPAERGVFDPAETNQAQSAPATNPQNGFGQGRDEIDNIDAELQRLRMQSEQSTDQQPLNNSRIDDMVKELERKTDEELDDPSSVVDDLDDTDLADSPRLPVKTCEEFRSQLLNNSIRDIALDISPPASRNRDQFVAISRSWTDRNGTIIATGSMVDLRRGYVIIDGVGGRQKIPFGKLSESDWAAISDYWQIPQLCSVGNRGTATRNWVPQTYTWKASSICHKPLYFENIQLERYGHSHGPFLQPVESVAHFFTSMFTLPYQTAIHPANECQYALGFYRPGNCAPWLKDPIPISLDGIRRQALVSTGVGLIP